MASIHKGGLENNKKSQLISGYYAIGNLKTIFLKTIKKTENLTKGKFGSKTINLLAINLINNL